MVVALDIETSAGGKASFQWYRNDFKVDSLALTYADGTTWFSANSWQIYGKLQQLSKDRTPLVVHNLQFESGVFSKLYPKLEFNWHADTMRLAQLYDAGGQEFATMPALSIEQELALELGETTEAELGKNFAKQIGLSLEACALRFLPAIHHNHKQVAHKWLEEHHKIKSRHGQYLHLLPPNILEAYNIADTNITLELYKVLTDRLHGFDWSRDWQLYTSRITQVNRAYKTGIKIDTAALYTYILDIEKEIAAMEHAFMERFTAEIDQVRDLKLLTAIEWANDPELKSDKARAKRFERLETGQVDDMWAEFNIGSNAQLERLFCDVLKIVPKFLTPKGGPSFKSSHLAQWGVGGEMLLKRKKRLLVLQQCVNTYLSAEYDGKAHPQIRASGTKTNRGSGGSL